MYLLHARVDQDIAHSAGVHESYPVNKSVIGTVLLPEGPICTYEDRPVLNHRAWGARIGSRENVGIAVVLPLDHPLAEPAEHMLKLVKEAADRIYTNLKEKRL